MPRPDLRVSFLYRRVASDLMGSKLLAHDGTRNSQRRWCENGGSSSPAD
ncbi:MAG: hypothetical protein KDA59_02255 [Planctomycetales bacterium]|nr:hypothetical protein [Planctomycetales bacterium]